jgi:isopentenyl diphosphate isomerase/L-lactate dehydrogenase-like FMN-dependent dehydrogenase
MADDGLRDEPGDRQLDIYLEGRLEGTTPEIPVAYEELEAAAHEKLADGPYGYVAGGAGGEHAVTHNQAAFDQWRIVPRLPRDVSDRDLSVSILGTDFPAPVMYAPVGVQSIVHEAGEVGTAEAAASLGVPMILSSAASATMEDVGQTLGDTPGWFQLYWPADRDLAASFVERAENAGFEAIVVTVDTPMLAWRERDLTEAYLPFLEADGVANYFADPVFRDRLDQPPEDDEFAAVQEFGRVFGNPALTYDDLAWLDDQTDLDILVKGVLHPDDAEEALENGADGVIVSNHGGRQVDRAVAALDALPAVADRVGGEVPVLFDSGIRRGADILVALALGADAILLGRPYVYGLALDGANGVETVTENLLADLDLTLGLCGHASVADVDEELLIRAGERPG